MARKNGGSEMHKIDKRMENLAISNGYWEKVVAEMQGAWN